MSTFQSLLNLFLAGILFCGVMPLFGGGLLYQGLQRIQIVEFPLRRCMYFFFAAAGAAYMLMMIVGRYLPGLGSVEGIVLAGMVVAAVELALIAVLVQKFTAKALLIEAASVVATNVAGYTVVATFLS